MRPRHSDADLVELAAAGSAPAFASLLHRHRDVLHRGALRAEHPEDAVESALVAAVRDLRRGRLRADDLRDQLDTLMESAVREDRGRPGVERLLPPDWFDRVWVRVEDRWPTGRRRLRAPRWTWHVVGAVVLAVAGAAGTFLVVTADVTTEVVSQLVAEPIEEFDAPAPDEAPAPEEQPSTESPELFDDVELGELPTYDLTGTGAAGDVPAGRPTIAPPPDPADGDDGDDEPRSADG